MLAAAVQNDPVGRPPRARSTISGNSSIKCTRKSVNALVAVSLSMMAKKEGYRDGVSTSATRRRSRSTS